MFIKVLLFIFFLLPVGAGAAAVADEIEFDEQRWFGVLHEIQNKAIEQGIRPRTINAVIQQSQFLPTVIRRDQNQSEFRLTLTEYINRTVTDARVRDGRAAKKRHADLLRRTERRFGVQPHVIMAFWGMESSYGTFKSTHQISDAFLTLIYDGRRRTFFTNQLMALMRIADKNNLDIENMHGSWAGAMGHFQFIPTTLEQYGADGDGDGRIDKINSLADGMASAGSYLRRLGWNQNERIVRQVTLPANFDRGLCDTRTKRSLAQWRQAGVQGVPQANMTAGILCDDSTFPKAWLTYANFDRIKRWNNSNAYALAIALLADRLRN